MEISRAKLGAWGELLVQRDLLLLDLDSARMTTDSGVDLMAYGAPGGKKVRFTIQVKTRTPRQKGSVYSWGVKKGKEHDTDLFALVMKDEQSALEGKDLRWYLGSSEFCKKAQLSGRYLRVRFRKSDGTTRTKDLSAFKDFQGIDGLKRFINSLRVMGRR